MEQLTEWQRSNQSAVLIGNRDKYLYFIGKRLLDVVLAIVLLILLAPVMLLVAILIKLDSAGPIFFTQERVGARRRSEGGQMNWEIRIFPFYKFRSMVRDADPHLHRAFARAFIHNDGINMVALQNRATQVRKLVNDPRVTRMGRFLRQSSLDELPQLWNVLKGDMSMVGPRPPIPYEVELYEPWHGQRLAAIPGITGLWQVTARSSVDFDEMVRLDIWYIEHQSLWLDLEILLKTPWAVLTSKGAL
jgi:lipopolysaccharide/colanic/teichoic acid biosynthesis glycosyltransferase